MADAAKGDVRKRTISVCYQLYAAINHSDFYRGLPERRRVDVLAGGDQCVVTGLKDGACRSLKKVFGAWIDLLNSTDREMWEVRDEIKQSRFRYYLWWKPEPQNIPPMSREVLPILSAWLKIVRKAARLCSTESREGRVLQTLLACIECFIIKASYSAREPGVPRAVLVPWVTRLCIYEATNMCQSRVSQEHGREDKIAGVAEQALLHVVSCAWTDQQYGILQLWPSTSGIR